MKWLCGVRRIVAWVGSLYFAVGLLIALAIACGWGTFVEQDFGTAVSGAILWRAAWFHTLLGLLGLNVAAALVARLPWHRQAWRWQTIPFLVAHVGILLLLVGCWRTHTAGTEGAWVISEGTASGLAARSHDWEFTVAFPQTDQTVTIPFAGGPFSKKLYSSEGWKEYVINPVESAQGPAHSWWERFARKIRRLQTGFVGWMVRRTIPEPGGPIYNADNLKIELVDYVLAGEVLEGGEGGMTITPLPFSKETANATYAQVKLRVTLDETESFVWLRTLPPHLSESNRRIFLRTVAGKDRTATISLANPTFDPGFSLFVKNFTPLYEPGSSTPASFSSVVDYTPTPTDSTPSTGSDTSTRSDTSAKSDVLIRMNHPGRFAPPNGQRWRVYQDKFRGPFFPGSGEFDSVVRGKLLPGEIVPRTQLYQTVLTLNNDPGRGLKYLGSLFISVGMAFLCFRWCRIPTESPPTNPPNADFATISSKISRRKRFYVAIGALLALFVMGAIIVKDQKRDIWSPWRTLPIYSGGRIMPLEGFARDVVREITGSESPVIEMPDGPRRFAPHELLFAWLAEPEKWLDLPILADPDETVGRLIGIKPIGAKGKNPPSSERNKRLVPSVVQKSEPFAKRLDAIQKRGTIQYADRAEGVHEGRIDRGCANVEARLARFRGLVFFPGGELSPMPGFYLDKLFVPPETLPGAEPGYAPLDELVISVRRLTALAGTRENRDFPSPMRDPDFLFAKTVRVGEPGRSVEIPAVVRKIHLLASVYPESPYRMSEKLFGSLLVDLEAGLSTLTQHRDEIFAAGTFSERYRHELLCAVRLLAQITREIEAAALYLSQNGSYRVSSLSDKKRLRPDSSGTTVSWYGVRAASLSIQAAGGICVVPNASATFLTRPENDIPPWITLQTLLFASDILKEKFCGGAIPEPSEVAENAADAENAEKPDSPQTDSAETTEIAKTADAADTAKTTETVATSRPPVTLRDTLQAVIAESRGATEDSAQKGVQEAFFAAASAYARLQGGTLGETFGGEKTENLQERQKAFSTALNGLADGLRQAAIVAEAARHSCWRNEEVRPELFLRTAYPKQKTAESKRLLVETFYYRLHPFGWFWKFAVMAFIAGMISVVAGMMRRTKNSRVSHFAAQGEICFFGIAIVALGAASLMAALGGSLRGYVTGWAPLTNQFETVIFLAFLVAVGTLCYGVAPFFAGLCGREVSPKNRFFRIPLLGKMVNFKLNDSTPTGGGFLERRAGLILGAGIASATAMLAVFNPAEFNPAIRPLVAVLRSNFWLTIHVAVIMVSYAVGFVAWGIAMGMLVRYFGPLRRTTVKGTPHPSPPTSGGIDPPFCVRLAPTVLTLFRAVALFLTLGILLGGLWADVSWGRFWSWDPKEVWALVTLLIYLAVLHLRAAGRLRVFGLALGGMLGGLAIVMTWYGLSFVFGGGRHTYAAGETNRTLVLWLLIGGNLAIGLAASLRYLWAAKRR